MIEFLVASGIGISLFVLVYLLRQDGIQLVSRRIAMAIQLVWLSRFVLFYLKPEAEPVHNAYLIMYDQTLFFLDGLLVWLYVRTLLRPDQSFKNVWLHFIPFGIVFTYSTVLATFLSEEVVAEFNRGIELLQTNQSNLETGELIFIMLLIGLNLFYLLRSVKITQTYNSRLKENLSNIDHLTIHWVKTFQNLWIILFIIPIIIYFLNDALRFTEHLSLGYLIIFSFLLLSVTFNFYLLEQVYKPVSLFTNAPKPTTGENNKAQKRQFEKLQQLLNNERYYLDESLSLTQLAGHMELKPAELTEVIKASPYENFYDLINSYRIEAIKEQLRTSSDQIIQLAYQNGFKSKSTFNKIFKEKTGMTPKDFRFSLK